MKNLLKVIFLSLTMTFMSCSQDELPAPTTEVIIPPIVVTTPVLPSTEIPAASLMKPAIRNINKISGSKTNGKTSTVSKRVNKSINYANNTASKNYKYLINITLEDYKKLPTDNLYDISEITLNLNSSRQAENTYVYNATKELTEIKFQMILPTNAEGPSQLFSYDTQGNLKATVQDVYGRSFTYNTKGLIDKKLKVDGTLEFTYEYDAQGRVINVFHYANDNVPDMRYVYSYTDNNFYWKVWYSINPINKSENKVDSCLYQHDPTKAGIYNAEPIYKLDNQHLHLVEITNYPKYNGFNASWSVRPKYFYNADGYLMKYDSAGLNNSGDIITYTYE